MKRTHVHLLVDAVMSGAGLVMVATGLLLRYILPAGSGQSSVWSLTRHDWGDWHFYAAVVIVVMVLVHVALQWNWVCTVVHRLFTNATGKLGISRLMAAGLTIVLVIGLLIAFLWLANQAKVDIPRGPRGPQHQQTFSADTMLPLDRPLRLYSHAIS